MRRVCAPSLIVCACIVWSHDLLEYVLIVQVNHCHEEQAKMKQKMEKIIALNKELMEFSDESLTRTEHVTREKATEMASKNEQIALLQLRVKELTDLQEEIQAKNQQVKQYKKQVDSYKAELERCQKELERCQGELLEVDVMGAMVLCGWSCACVYMCVWGAHMYVCMCRCVLSCVLWCVHA